MELSISGRHRNGKVEAVWVGQEDVEIAEEEVYEMIEGGWASLSDDLGQSR